MLHIWHRAKDVFKPVQQKCFPQNHSLSAEITRGPKIEMFLQDWPRCQVVSRSNNKVFTVQGVSFFCFFVFVSLVRNYWHWQMSTKYHAAMILIECMCCSADCILGVTATSKIYKSCFLSQIYLHAQRKMHTYVHPSIHPSIHTYMYIYM